MFYRRAMITRCRALRSYSVGACDEFNRMLLGWNCVLSLLDLCDFQIQDSKIIYLSMTLNLIYLSIYPSIMLRPTRHSIYMVWYGMVWLMFEDSYVTWRGFWPSWPWATWFGASGKWRTSLYRPCATSGRSSRSAPSPALVLLWYFLMLSNHQLRDCLECSVRRNNFSRAARRDVRLNRWEDNTL